MTRNAWVTIAYDETTCLQALVLAKSLQRVITSADTVVLVSQDVSQSLRVTLSEIFDVVFGVENFSEKLKLDFLTPLDAAKIFSWSLTMYSTCVLLDPTIVVIKNADELFECKTPIALLSSSGSNIDFDNSLIVIKPSYIMYSKWLSSMTNHSLASTPPDKLSFNKMISKWLLFEQFDTNLQCDILERVKPTQGIHYDGLKKGTKFWNLEDIKPWLFINLAETAKIDNDKFVNIWINIFIELLPIILKNKNLTFNKQLLDNLKKYEIKKETYDKSAHTDLKDSIAIIGQSCRLPGANNIEEFWKLVESGGDGITAIPLERLQEHQTADPRYTSIKAGFLKCPIDEFDAKFFGISPREAAFMDPQQRLMVEVAWEALEDAAINPLRLKGSNTGVYSGVWTHEYESLLKANTSGHDFHHVVLGNAFSATSARVSYFLGLNGPNVATESGCSSSMVALHLACDSLRKRETDLALATGVNLLIDHFPHSEVSILAKDGHCKTFDEKADGFARAEGVVVVVLKRLSDAVRDGDRIISIIRGSALSNEGTTTSFGTPSKYCQEIAIKDALKVAGVKPEEVDYVEAHGTGTPIGDPIEFAAISAGYKAQREKPLIIGSVKTNTGHTESAAGLAGLLKVNLAMQNQCIPPHRNLSSVNPNIDLNALPAHIPLEPMTWNRNPQRKRLAAVSSFGISGTNVHVILQEPPLSCKNELNKTPPCDRSHHLLTLSAKTENALGEMVDIYKGYLETHAEFDLKDICYTANVGRQHLKHRFTAVAKDKNDMIQKLVKISGSSEPRTNDEPKIAFLFTGQGSQYTGMAKSLYETNTIFKKHFNECNEIVVNNAGISIGDVLWGDGKQYNLDETLYSQTAIFCVEYGLLKLWENFGIKPDYVLGHSVGEFAASVAAGIMSLEEALTMVIDRSRLICEVEKGGMLAVCTDQRKVIQLIHSFSASNPEHWLDVAVINSPNELVVAGRKSSLKLFADFCAAHQIKTQLLAASHAFHSRHMEGILQEFGRACNKIVYNSPRCHYVSGSTGVLLQEGEMDGEYWQNHARNTVDFTKGIKSLQNEGCNILIEIGAHPILLALGMSNLMGTEPQNILWLPSIRRNEDNWLTLLSSVSKLYLQGLDVDWEGLDSGQEREKVSLPHYPFQRQKYWFETKSEPITKPLHPLLGRKLPLAVVKEHVYQNTIDLNDFSYLMDHKVANIIVFPGAGFLEIILAAGKDILSDDLNKGRIRVEDFVVEAPMELREDKEHELQVVASEIDNNEGFLVRVYLYKNLNGYNDEKGWKLFASAKVGLDIKISKIDDDLRNATSRCTIETSSNEFYKNAAEIGIQFGDTFKSISTIFKGTDEAISKVPCPTTAGNMKKYVLHPIVLDSMIQTASLAMDERNTDLYLPVGIKNFTFVSKSCSPIFFAHAYRGASNGALCVHLYDEESNILAIMNDLKLVKTSIGSFTNVIGAFKNKLPGIYQLTWRSRECPLNYRVNLSKVSKRNIIFDQINESLQDTRDHIKLDMRHADDLCVCYIILAFDNLGWKPQNGDTFTSKTLISNLLLSPLHFRLVERLLGILAEDGILQRLGISEWIFKLPSLSRREWIEKRNKILAKSEGLPNKWVELSILSHVGKNLVDILQGKISGVNVLFDNKNPELDPKLIYTHGACVTLANVVLKYYVSSILQHIKSEGSVVRILEIGAGSGATSKQIIDGLQKEGIAFRYTFTDLSPQFLSDAKKIFKNSTDIEFKVLNIENDPKYQGFIPYSYDIVVAANVIHATQYLSASIQNVRQLLAPQGYFILQEMFSPIRTVDITFGILEGYWCFKDLDTRTDHPCVNQATWTNVLLKNGFKSVENISYDEDFVSDLVAQASDLNEVYYEQQSSLLLTKPVAWVVFTGKNSIVADKLEKRVKNVGYNLIVVNMESDNLNCTDKNQLNTFLSEVIVKYDVKGYILLLSSLETSHNQDIFCQSALYIFQFLSTNHTKIKIICATRGVYMIGDQGSTNPSHATVLGVFKSLRNEFFTISHCSVDFDPDYIDSSHEFSQIFNEMWSQEEEIIAYRKSKRHVLRMSALGAQPAPLVLPKGRYEITIPKTNALQDVSFESQEMLPIEPDDVEISVKATALNFRDILIILKPEITKFKAVGTDFSGVITKVGKSVTKYDIGDVVFGISHSSAVASHVVVSSDLLFHKPNHFTFAEASTLPSVCLTACLCLINVGKLRSEETILIHVASGGVGLVAIQIARYIGANIIATAGSKRKRAYLRSIGMKHVFHSRDLTFGSKIDEATNGRGVDMVLNSLTGEGFKETSLKACARNARFVEMGKVNIWKLEDVKKLRPDVQYTIVNLEVVERREMRTLMSVMWDLVKNKIVTPLPYTRFFVTQIKDALNYFLKAQHIGKVVVSIPEVKVSLGKQFVNDILFNDNVTYLVTGGLGGIGLEVAKWMVKCGARHVVLVGRTAPNEKIQQILKCLSTKGVKVLSRQVDVGDWSQCNDLFDIIKMEMPPLRGIIHSAGTLSDGIIQNQTWEKFETVFNAKVKGGWNLHNLTKNLELEHFVVFSSMAALVGNLGQSNHSAANMYLDALVAHRHSLGLPAQTINWGAWSEVGAAINTSFGKEGAFGIHPFTPTQGISALKFCMSLPFTQLGIVQIDYKVFCESFDANLVSELAEETNVSETKSAHSEQFWTEMETFSLEERIEYIKNYVISIIQQTLKLPSSEKIDEHQTFSDMGLDSLMAVEMRNKLQQLFGQRLSLNPSSLLDYPTLNAFTNYLANLTMSTHLEVSNESTIDYGFNLALEDSKLPDSIQKINEPIAPSKIRNILLTGTTGLFAPYVLAELAKNKNVTIFCLIRTSKNLTAEKRLRHNLKKHDLLNNTSMSTNVLAMAGDVTQEYLGMSKQEYDKLASDVDAVFHCAVKTNHIEKYMISNSKLDIRSVNVLGTVNILNFASKSKTKRVYYVSSWSAATKIDTDGFISDELPTDENKVEDLKKGGYPLTKFVGERLMAQANQRGIPCTVLRFPSMAGHSETGRFPPDANFIMNSLLSALRYKVFCNIPGGWHFIPVNIAAKISTLILFNDHAQIGLYNVTDGVAMTTDDFVRISSKIGCPIQIVGEKEFIEILLSDNPLLNIFKESYGQDDPMEFFVGYSPTLKHTLQAKGSKIYTVRKKMLQAIPNFNTIIPHPALVVERQLQYAKRSGLLDRLDIQIKL